MVLTPSSTCADAPEFCVALKTNLALRSRSVAELAWPSYP
jgi:hypothetical protein